MLAWQRKRHFAKPIGQTKKRIREPVVEGRLEAAIDEKAWTINQERAVDLTSPTPPSHVGTCCDLDPGDRFTFFVDG